MFVSVVRYDHVYIQTEPIEWLNQDDDDDDDDDKVRLTDRVRMTTSN